MSALRTVKEYLLTHYGHLVHASEPVFNEEESSHISKLYSSYPITIRDDKGMRRFVRYIDVPYLGEIVLTEKLYLRSSKTTTRKELNKRLTEFLRIWTENAENLVLSATADLVANLPIIPVVLNPVKVIVEQLWNNNKINDSQLKIARTKDKAARYRKYLELMKGIGLVQRHESSWLPGEDFTKIQSQIRRLDEGRTKIFAIILKRRYIALKQVFDIKNLERVIKIENAVYMPEIEEKKAVYRDIRSVGSDLYRFYNDRVNPQEISSTLRDLVEVGAVVSEKDLFAGDDNIRSEVISNKASQPSVQSRWLAAYA
jgi:hypothetical protein